MDIKKLKIGVLLNQNNENIIGANFFDKQDAEDARLLAPKEIENKLRGKSFFILYKETSVDLKVSDIEVTSSLSDNKSVYLKTNLKSLENININDIIEVRNE